MVFGRGKVTLCTFRATILELFFNILLFLPFKKNVYFKMLSLYTHTHTHTHTRVCDFFFFFFFIDKRQYIDKKKKNRRYTGVYEREANREQARGQKTYRTTLTKKKNPLNSPTPQPRRLPQVKKSILGGTIGFQIDR